MNWEVLSINSSGILDWQSSHWGGIAKYEKYFEQDLNGDGGIGLSAALTSITTDVYGATLKRDSENSLYIDIDGDNATTNDIISVTDTWGGSPSFDYSDEWSNQWDLALQRQNLVPLKSFRMEHLSWQLKGQIYMVRTQI